MSVESTIPTISRRFWARIIDGLILLILEAPFWKAVYSLLWAEQTNIQVPWALFFYFVIMHFSYQFFSFWIFGRTIGKWLCGIKVTSIIDESLSASQSALRVFLSWFSFYFSWGLYATCYFRIDRRHWIDQWCETKVILTKTQAQTEPHQVRLWWGSCLVFIFAISGIFKATRSLQGIEIGRSGVTINLQALDLPSASDFNLLDDENSEDVD